jgi:hypothetical protein
LPLLSGDFARHDLSGDLMGCSEGNERRGLSSGDDLKSCEDLRLISLNDCSRLLGANSDLTSTCIGGIDGSCLNWVFPSNFVISVKGAPVKGASVAGTTVGGTPVVAAPAKGVPVEGTSVEEAADFGSFLALSTEICFRSLGSKSFG